MSKLLDERPIVIQPSMVKAFGFERATILQQIHYHLESPKSGKIIEGEKWIWNTYEEWAEEFIFWEPRTIRKWMAKLEEEKLIVTAQFDKGDWNRRKYYRIDYEVFHAKIGASKRHDDDASAAHESDTTMRHDDDASESHQDDGSFKRTDTSTKRSTEISTENPPPTSPHSNLKPYQIVFTHWQIIHNHPKAHLDKKRERLIEARLKDGFSVDDLKLAIEGNKLSPFHQGQNDGGTIYDGIDLIFRDAAKVESFIANYNRVQMRTGGNGNDFRHNGQPAAPLTKSEQIRQHNLALIARRHGNGAYVEGEIINEQSGSKRF